MDIFVITKIKYLDMNKIITSLSLVFIFFCSTVLYSQCSDAGVCIIGDKHHKSEVPRSSLSFAYSVGQSGNTVAGTDDNITFHTFKFGGNLAFSKAFSVSAVIPVVSMIYQLPLKPSKNGLADATVLANYNIPTGKLKNISFMGGFKLATSSVEKNKFDFFNGQGTNDLLLGVDYNYSFLNVSAGMQIPLTKYDNEGVTFKRGTDLLIRAGYQRKADDLIVKFEMLGIKRLNKSEFGTPYVPAYQIEKSDFFQLNIMGGLMYYFTNDFIAGLNLYFPMLKRDENSDGTKRTFTVSAGFSYLLNI
ncbi:MAG: hypothetical protein PHN88_01900 [Ignavibacteria bacterium]|nr:hypothetical protein [Ignavibacteria bacterium]